MSDVDQLSVDLLVSSFDRRRRGDTVTFSAAFMEGCQRLRDQFPKWANVDGAATAYGHAYEDGWIQAHHRITIALGLPEARGREREAIALAAEPALTFDEVAARLRAAAPRSESVAGTDNVVAFRRPAG